MWWAMYWFLTGPKFYLLTTEGQHGCQPNLINIEILLEDPLLAGRLKLRIIDNFPSMFPKRPDKRFMFPRFREPIRKFLFTIHPPETNIGLVEPFFDRQQFDGSSFFFHMKSTGLNLAHTIIYIFSHHKSCMTQFLSSIHQFFSNQVFSHVTNHSIQVSQTHEGQEHSQTSELQRK